MAPHARQVNASGPIAISRPQNSRRTVQGSPKLLPYLVVGILGLLVLSGLGSGLFTSGNGAVPHGATPATVTPLGGALKISIYIHTATNSGCYGLNFVNGTTGTAPCALWFTANVSGGTSPYGPVDWNFSDTGFTSGSNVNHTYTSTGVYTIKANVTDNASTHVSTSTTIQIYPATVSVWLTPTPVTGTAPLVVRFAASAIGGFAPYTYSYLFGDGGYIPSTANASENHTYLSAGNYTAWLFVNDSKGNHAQVSASQLVTVCAGNCTSGSGSGGPGVTPSCNPQNGLAPLAVVCGANVTGGPLVGHGAWTFRWAFPDNGTTTYLTEYGNNSQAGFTFQSLGWHDVQVVGNDSANRNGTTDNVSGSLWEYVYDVESLTLNATPGTGASSLAVNFLVTLHGGTTGWFNWSFGDGTFYQPSLFNATSEAVGHSYAAAGNYTVVVTTSTPSGNISATAHLDLVAPSSTQVAVVAIANQTSGPAPLAVHLTANISNGVGTYVAGWAFGDGTSSPAETTAGFSVDHVYFAVGTFTATVWVSNATNMNFTFAWVNITVTATALSPVSVSLVVAPSSGSAPLNVTISGAPSGGTAPYQLVLCADASSANVSVCNVTTASFTPAANQSAVYNYTYGQAGIYTVTGLVADANGVDAFATATVNVTPSAPLGASAMANVTTGGAPLKVAFSLIVEGGTAPYSVQWSFGDGSVGSSIVGQSAGHEYTVVGTYVPTVVVQDSAGHSVKVTLASIRVTAGNSGITNNNGLVPGALDPAVLVVAAALVAGLILAVGFRRRRMKWQQEGATLLQQLESPNAEPESPELGS
ncbi:MAG: PKD domain-containing protein [Thermoplasmata archaeon]|nr:PKD domain-containing protein [Thermoplasmata archaeon]